MKYNKLFANELPAAVKAFVMKCFPSLSIAFAERNDTTPATGYVVSLNDGTELRFSHEGACTNVYRERGLTPMF